MSWNIVKFWVCAGLVIEGIAVAHENATKCEPGELCRELPVVFTDEEPAHPYQPTPTSFRPMAAYTASSLGLLRLTVPHKI